jgi:hypothetical protein
MFCTQTEAHRSIVLEAFSTAWVCSCKCPCDRLVQTAAEAADETKWLDTDSLVPNAMESDAGTQV